MAMCPHHRFQCTLWKPIPQFWAMNPLPEFMLMSFERKSPLIRIWLWGWSIWVVMIELFWLTLSIFPPFCQMCTWLYRDSLIVDVLNGMLQIMLDAVEQVKGIFLITADHGNAEDMVKRNLKTGAPVKNKKGETEVLTSHTCNPVSSRTSSSRFHNSLFSGEEE